MEILSGCASFKPMILQLDSAALAQMGQCRVAGRKFSLRIPAWRSENQKFARDALARVVAKEKRFLGNRAVSWGV